MKKIITASFIGLLCVLALASCEGENPCKSGHTLEPFLENGDATCESDGTKSAKCTVCQQTVTISDEDSALGHDLSEYVSCADASCERDGTKSAVCHRCGAVDTVTDEGTRLSHSLGDFVSAGDGHRRECTECAFTTDVEAHDYVGGRCLVCDSVYTSQNTDVLTVTYTDMGSYYAVSGYEGEGEILSIPQSYNGKSVTAISEGAFSGLKSLRQVTIPESITSIGKDAFLGCTGLQRLNISCLERWCKLSFANRYSNPLYYSHALYLNEKEVTELNIPDSVTSIGNYAFIGGYGFKKINVPEGVRTIGANTFTSCRSITTLVIPDSVTHIHTSAFFDCNDLVSVTLGASVEYINETAFIDCYKMVEVINNSSLDVVAGSTDYGKVGLYALEVHSGPSRLVCEGDYIFYTYEDKNYLVAYTGGDNSPTLPTSFMGDGYAIYEYAFYRHFYLSSLLIPEGVSEIGQKVFSQCTNLREITLPTTLEKIGKEAFYNCHRLSSVYISDIASYLKIDYTTKDSNPTYHAGALYINRTALTHLTLPNSISEIKSYALAGLESLIYLNLHTGVTKIAENALCDCTSLVAIYYDGTREQWAKIEGSATELYSLSVVCLADGENTPKKATVPGAILKEDFEKYIVEPMFEGLEALLTKHLGEFSLTTVISVSGYGRLKSFNPYRTDKSALTKHGAINSTRVFAVTKEYLSYAQAVIGKTTDKGYKEIASYISAMNTVFGEYSEYNTEALLDLYPYLDDYYTAEERAEYKALYDATVEKWQKNLPAINNSSTCAYAIDKSLDEESIARKYDLIFSSLSLCVPDMNEELAKACEDRAGYTPYFGR
ncbi:MAG: leucine-rich repeat domain-containing protein [Clostridia bacterium]|nr:leucine-rich repeat domain-containing protein [Clostridia bacterium]